MKRWLTFTVIICLSACMKPEDLQKNPNKANTSPPGNVLTGVEMDMFYSPWDYPQRSSQYHCMTNPYYGGQSYNFGSASHRFYQIRNVMQMEREAVRTNDPARRGYAAVGLFLKAWFYIQMTQQMGDIPMSQSMMAEQEIISPEYDAQKDVYRQCLELLRRANDSLDVINNTATQQLAGDIFYRGDLDKWQRLVNAFRLRVLISLSKKAHDPDLKIPETFAAIVQHPERCPLPRDNRDNLEVTYGEDDVTNYNPGYSATPEASSRNNPLAATYVSLMTGLRDPRLFVVAQPSRQSDSLPDNKNDFRSYRGAGTGTLQKLISDSAAMGYYAHPDPEYWFSSKTGRPTIMLGFPETQFAIAEGINRGWADGDAEAAYTAGIRAAMKAYGLEGKVVDNYLQQAVVRYAGDNMQGLVQILHQKYIDFFQMGGWEAFLNQRRTGIPVFHIGPSNENSGRIPLRWSYPPYEYIDNLKNLQAALSRQYQGLDQLNGRMWSLQ